MFFAIKVNSSSAGKKDSKSALVCVFTVALALTVQCSQQRSEQPAKAYSNEEFGLSLVIPSGWLLSDKQFQFQHYSTGVLSIDNKRAGLQMMEQKVSDGVYEFNDTIAYQLLKPGEIHVAVSLGGGPAPSPDMRVINEEIETDLHTILVAGEIERSSTAYGLSVLTIQFRKTGRLWQIVMYMRDPVTEMDSKTAMKVLDSMRFSDSPLQDAMWAETRAWRALPNDMRSLSWPVVDSPEQRRHLEGRTVSVSAASEGFTVAFEVNDGRRAIYSVSGAGNVELLK